MIYQELTLWKGNENERKKRRVICMVICRIAGLVIVVSHSRMGCRRYKLKIH